MAEAPAPPKSAGPSVTPAQEEKPAPLPVLSDYLAITQKVGAGSYGEVYLCDDKRANPPNQVAVKWVKDFARDPLCGKRILREIRLLSAMRHENLLSLVDVLPAPHPDFDDVYIVMPAMHSDLHKVIYSRMKLSDNHTEAFVCQILRGVKYLHSAGVVHRDLKPSNVLVNKDCTLRIADFGLARALVNEEEQLTDYVVTRWYRAPELMLLPSGYGEAVDLWSVGCIHVECLAREALFPGRDHLDMLRNIANCLGFVPQRDLAWLPTGDDVKETLRQESVQVQRMASTLNLPAEPVAGKSLEERIPNASDACINLVRQLLAYDPTRRISATDAIAHPYLAHLRDPLGETTAPKLFAWDFDRFEATKRNLKDRIYAESAKLHPEIIQRDAEWLQARGFMLPQGGAAMGAAAVGGAAAAGATAAAVATVATVATAPPVTGPPPSRPPRPSSQQAVTSN